MLRSALSLACAVIAACSHVRWDELLLAQALGSQPIVLLGEVHDNAAQHALRARALRHLLESGTRPALLMEQFDRDRQPEIDHAMAQPGATTDAVIAAAGAQNAGWAWPLYQPYVALALEYRLPLLAANVSRADARRVSTEGLAAGGFESAVPADIGSYQTRAIVDSHCGMIDAVQARRMAASQVARDQFMAHLLLENSAHGAVLLAGNGHVRADMGVPRWLPASARQRSVAIGVLETDDADTGAFDRVFTTPAQTRADPCDGMRRPVR